VALTALWQHGIAFLSGWTAAACSGGEGLEEKGEKRTEGEVKKVNNYF
jgi:hypothetical protein